MTRNIVICTLLLVFIGFPAVAQYEVDDRDKVGLRLGLFRPSDSDLQDIGKLWMGPVVDWYLKHDEQDRPVRFLSAAILAEDKDFVRNETTKVLLAPITYNWIKRYSESERHWYAGGGVGLCFMKFKIDSYARNISDSSLKVGFKLIGGYNINEHFFAEMHYDLLPKWQTVNWSGLSIQVGTRTSF